MIKDWRVEIYVESLGCVGPMRANLADAELVKIAFYHNGNATVEWTKQKTDAELFKSGTYEEKTLSIFYQGSPVFLGKITNHTTTCCAAILVAESK